MEIEKEIAVTIDGLLIFKSPLHPDERGYFVENWRKVDLLSHGVPETFFYKKLQNNVSVSKKGTIRGMHCQGWAKLMTVAYGKFRMCFVDLRKDSSTYKAVQVVDVEPGMAVFVPAGVSNGAQSLVENGILNYLVTGYYEPKKEHLGITPLDEELNLPWNRESSPIISSKDKRACSYSEVLRKIEQEEISVAVIGDTGAVGQVVMEQLSQYSKYKVYGFRRENVHQLCDKRYDIVICTAPSSGKLLTNLGLANDDADIQLLLEVIQKVKTNHFILVSTQAVFNQESRYSKVHQKMVETVQKYQKEHTIYLMDTLYGDTLQKGFIHDILTTQWSYVSAEKIEKVPELEYYFEPLTASLWKRVKKVPNEINERIESITSLYSNSQYFQVTAIDNLVMEIITEIQQPRGIKMQIKETVIYTGKQMKQLFERPDSSLLGTYFKERKMNLENL